MDIQGIILLTMGILGSLVIAVFVVVAWSSRGEPQDYGQVQPRGYGVRRVWFWFLAVVVVVAFGVGARRVPYVQDGISDAINFPVVARQYVFENLPAVVPYNTPVVFNVTAADVNHGFAIYDPDERIVGQVQAMPGYANHLRITFTQKGQYTVRCLEYCGLSHAFMQGHFEVE